MCNRKNHYKKEIKPKSLSGKCADCTHRHYHSDNYLYVCDTCIHQLNWKGQNEKEVERNN